MPTIFLQHVDGTIESLDVSAGSASNKVVLAGAPRLALAVDGDLSGQARFDIVPDGSPIARAFLVTEKDAKSTFTSVVKAVNYDDRYYANDYDNPTEEGWSE